MELSNEDLTITKWDAAEYINTKEFALEYLAAGLEGNDPEHIMGVIADIARSKGGMELSKVLPDLFDRNGLYNSLTMVVKVLDALGFQLNITQKKAS
jgi:probable addiction module antidote protein